MAAGDYSGGGNVAAGSGTDGGDSGDDSGGHSDGGGDDVGPTTLTLHNHVTMRSST